MNEKDFINLLKEEMKPALGVTEPGAIALASSKAYEAACKGELKEIKLILDPGIFKNCYSCAIPGTDDFGIEIAALLGVLSGKPDLEMEVLKYVKKEDAKKAQKLKDENFVVVELKKDCDGIYIDCTVTTDKGWGKVIIKDKHSNIILIENNSGIVLKKDEIKNENIKEKIFDIKEINLKDIVNFVDMVSYEDIKFVMEAVDMNLELGKYSMNGAGMNVSLALNNLIQNNIISDDIVLYAQTLTGYAMDSRLGGVPKPAMSICGSGSHGIIATMPIYAVSKKRNICNEILARSIVLSFLITIYIKEFSGRLSAFCGCAIAAGTGASVGIVYLLGGSLSQMNYAINNIAGNITGMICDGGNYGCALKAVTASNVAVMSAFFALGNVSIPSNCGIVGKSAEETMKNMGKIASPGMIETENTILNIMLKN